jgi:recombination protein RecA
MPRKKPAPLDPGTASAVALDAIAAGISKRFGPGAMRRLSQPGGYPDIRRVAKTGLPTLDAAIGVGGLPFGKLIEVFGPESVGKSTLVKFLGGQFQKQGIGVGFLDAEQSGDPKWDASLGLVLDQAIGGQPDALEDVFLWLAEGIRLAVKHRVDMFFFWDSLAATLLRVENKRKLEELGPPGERARYLSQKLKPLVTALQSPGARANVGLLVVNQVRENIGGGRWAEKTVSPGGRALRHYAHLKLRMARIGQVKHGDEVVGIRSAIRVAKSKISAPFGEAVIEILFDPPQVREMTT